MTDDFIIRGDICYSTDKDNLSTYEDHYLICEQGACRGVFSKIPSKYENFTVIDCKSMLVMPGLIDLHLHAPQFAFRGLGMDLKLLEWLDQVTFPEERKYEDIEYAKTAYSIFTNELSKSATTRACIFATIHTEATLLLMTMLEQSGMIAYVGKVNMDRNAPAYLCEDSAEQSIKDTIDWIYKSKQSLKRVKPILTPRFIPTCTDELMRGLSKLARKYQLSVQSHLSEAQGEIEWVHELCPSAKFYGDAYEQFDLFGGNIPTIMAHCVSSSENEIKRIKERGVYIAHCAQSNTNLSSGIAPVRRFLDDGLKVGLGTDIGGGSNESVFEAMADTIQVSKLRNCLIDRSQEPVTTKEAFYLGTKGGGAFFGKVGSFEEGYEFDAVIIDDSNLSHPQPLTVMQRLERVIYLSQQCKITHKFAAGKQIF